ncbi:MAG: DUF1566 domain-containing protein [Melioribacteraceae bacterium]
MKTTKYILAFCLFTFVFVFTTAFAQEAKQSKRKVEEKTQQRDSRNGTEGLTAVGDKILFKNSSNQNILQIIEETNSSASILFFNKNNFIGPSRRLLNEDGKLMWGTEEVAGTYAVGDLTQGGYVIEVTPDGHHGLVAALQDQNTSVNWYESNDVLSNAATHETRGKNYKDWRLPTKRELNLMYNQRTAIGNFAISAYWSSTEYLNGTAWSQSFGTGTQNTNVKATTLYVRAVRVF